LFHLQENKLSQLCRWWKEAKKIVVLTGAGISTSAGVADFRGPQGVWTLELEREREKQQLKRKRKNSSRPFGKRRKRKRKPTASTTGTTDHNDHKNTLFPTESTTSTSGFEAARPTVTHRALTRLVQQNKCNFIVTQNVDGLHQRSGLARSKLAILHGCVFEEQCEDCKALYFRDKEVDSISFQPTGQTCKQCNGVCRDTLLDWEDALPEDQLCPSEEACTSADLIVTLGTSLRIEPAASLPLLCKQQTTASVKCSKPHIVIVNLQETPKDSASDMLIRANVDVVMERVAATLLGSNWDD
jgi:mono-ADP-ribosyltransferase sirtuin 6